MVIFPSNFFISFLLGLGVLAFPLQSIEAAKEEIPPELSHGSVIPMALQESNRFELKPYHRSVIQNPYRVRVIKATNLPDTLPEFSLPETLPPFNFVAATVIPRGPDSLLFTLYSQKMNFEGRVVEVTLCDCVEKKGAWHVKLLKGNRVFTNELSQKERGGISKLAVGINLREAKAKSKLYQELFPFASRAFLETESLLSSSTDPDPSACDESSVDDPEPLLTPRKPSWAARIWGTCCRF